MTSEITIYDAPLSERLQYADELSKASNLPQSYREKPGNILLAIEYGQGLGISPVQAITGIHVVEGRPSISSDLMAAVVRAAGHTLRIIKTDSPLSVTAVLIRKDDPAFEYKATWNLEKAKTAGLIGGSRPNPAWRKYPDQMMRARAISQVCRDGASECLYGAIYTPDELDSAPRDVRAPITLKPPSEPDPIPVDVEIVESEPEQTPVPVALATADQLSIIKNHFGDTPLPKAMEWISDLLQYTISKPADLTEAEAAEVIAAISNPVEVAPSE